MTRREQELLGACLLSMAREYDAGRPLAPVVEAQIGGSALLRDLGLLLRAHAAGEPPPVTVPHWRTVGEQLGWGRSATYARLQGKVGFDAAELVQLADGAGLELEGLTREMARRQAEHGEASADSGRGGES